METLAQLERFCAEYNIVCERAAPLCEHSTFAIGGPAGLLVHPEGTGQLRSVLREAQRLGLPRFVLGKGSNVLFADAGFPGVVVQIGKGLSSMRLEDETTIFCESGAALSELCLFAYRQGLTGLEFAYGIPGSVGGAVYMNAGAYGGEMKDVLVRTEHLLPDGEAGSFAGEQMQLSYRHSAYTDSELVITGAAVRLKKGDPQQIRAKMQELMDRRRTKQPLEYPSAGSTFRRPQGAYASALIDGCGLKGARVGGAMVSEKHAGFVVNMGGATCSDVQKLIAHIQRVVKEQTGFTLECEVKIIE